MYVATYCYVVVCKKQIKQKTNMTNICNPPVKGIFLAPNPLKYVYLKQIID